MNMKIPDDELEKLKNVKVPDEMIEKFMEECAVDNSRLEELIKEMDEGLVDPKKREEFFELFKKSNLHMPVVLSDEWFEDIENFEPGRIRTTGENAGFNINYIKLGGDEKAVPLFTSRFAPIAINIAPIINNATFFANIARIYSGLHEFFQIFTIPGIPAVKECSNCSVNMRYAFSIRPRKYFCAIRIWSSM